MSQSPWCFRVTAIQVIITNFIIWFIPTKKSKIYDPPNSAQFFPGEIIKFLPSETFFLSFPLLFFHFFKLNSFVQNFCNRMSKGIKISCKSIQWFYCTSCHMSTYTSLLNVPVQVSFFVLLSAKSLGYLGLNNTCKWFGCKRDKVDLKMFKNKEKLLFNAINQCYLLHQMWYDQAESVVCRQYWF